MWKLAPALVSLTLTAACAELSEEALDEVAGTGQSVLDEDDQLIQWKYGGSPNSRDVLARSGHAVAHANTYLFTSCETDGGVLCVDRFVQETVEIGGREVKLWRHRQRIDAPGPANESFARSLAAGGTTLVVGSPVENNVGAAPGSVYVYGAANNGYELLQTLHPPDADLSDEINFGAALDLAGDVLVVGVNRDRRGKGAAYIYERVNGQFRFRQRLADPQAESDYNFGKQVAVLGNRVIVSEPGRGVQPVIDGRVRVYLRSGNTWALEDTLAVNERGSPDLGFPDSGDDFGSALAVHGTRLAVRSWANLHLYELRNNRFQRLWTQPAEVPGTPGPSSVVMDDISIVVGYPDTAEGVGPGMAVSYAHSIDANPIVLRPRVPQAANRFGYALALDGNVLVVGEPGRTFDDDAWGRGTASAYRRVRTSLFPIP